MRQYSEPSCRHLLRQPLIFGVPFVGLLILVVVTVGLQVLAQGHSVRCMVGMGVSVVAYVLLRTFTRFAKSGWDEGLLFLLERLFTTSDGRLGKLDVISTDIEVISPDTLDEDGLLSAKLLLEDELSHLKPEETRTLHCRMDARGALLTELRASEPCERVRKQRDLDEAFARFAGEGYKDVYSLYQIPVSTDPLWIFSHFKELKQDFQVFVSYRGVDQFQIKARIEAARRFNASTHGVGAIDSDITFEEASLVLRGLSRGDDRVVELSLVILSREPLPLDPHFFLREKIPALALLSVLGLRARFHRSHFVRVVTASDLTPHISDPFEDGTAILRTVRDKPLYFDPLDKRLDALHWLVVGATGTGKSFLVGSTLLRLIQAGRPMSVLFVDHGRSFKRLVLSLSGAYIEPTSFEDMQGDLPLVLKAVDSPGRMAGIELSELPLREKQACAVEILRAIAEFLKARSSPHVLYVVIDECWKFLKDDRQGVQAAFREFRKADAAAIAITQSLEDFLSDETGQSIIQNASIRILLRQQEDVTPYKSLLSLTAAEMSKVKSIKKKNGVYSECLIKTPYLARFGRLYTTPEEHELLRTDNLRAARIADVQALAPAVTL
jgi:hypothetical protein